jgi:shikimate dehydrogenase
MKAAVLGHPVRRSLSPALHNAGYRALGMVGWTYTAIDCTEDRFDRVLGRAGHGCAGFSVTMPLKRVALAAATRRTSLAQVTGAANTMLPRRHGWLADNTDVAGIVAALRVRRIEPARGSVVLLGAGGAAQAAIVALASLGVRRVTVAVRSAARAADLVSTARRAKISVQLTDLSPHVLRDAALVVSALPAEAAARVAGFPVSPDQALFDMVYQPWPTPLARPYLAVGAPVASGHDMLLHQAARQFELMTGRDAPLAAMRAALPAHA